MVLLGEKSGVNINMTDDGQVVGQKVLCEKGCTEQRKETKKAKRFTVIGLTKLLG